MTLSPIKNRRPLERPPVGFRPIAPTRTTGIGTMTNIIFESARRNPATDRSPSSRRLRLYGPRYIRGRRSNRLTAVWTWRAQRVVAWGLQ
jgi:hypothetical protein